MRKHVRDLAAKEANGKIEEFIITWPVNKYSAPLSVDPSVILGARRLEDVTWHDIPVRRWLLLTADEKTNLKEDIWFYSRTGLREDAARAATALADEIKAGRKVQGWPEGAGAGDDKSFASAVDMSGNLVATMTYSCSKCAVPSSAVTGWDFKPSTHNQANRWGCKVCFGPYSGDVSTGQAVVAAPCGKNIQIHTPFGEDVATYLDNIHKDAWRWVVCQRKMGLFQLMAAPAGVTGDGEFADYKKRVMENWAFPDLTPEGDDLKANWVSRCEQLLSEIPKHTDGEHARWLDAPQALTASGSGFNSIDAVLRRHNCEIKVMEVKRWVRWEEETPYPEEVEWEWRNEAWHYEYKRRTCFTLSEVFQYYPGSARSLYLWYCYNGDIVRHAKKTTQSVKAAAEFSGRLTMKAPARAWLKDMAMQVPKDFRDQFGRELKSGLTAGLMAKAREQVSAAIQTALRDTANRTVNLNVYMKKRPYVYPAADFIRLTWAVMHDERLIMLLSDPSLSIEFVSDVRRVYKEQGWPEGAGAGDDKSFAYAVDMSGNLVATMTYSCSKCAVASSALTGWDYKPSTNNQPNRWGCKVCWQNWLRDTDMSIVIHVRSKDRSFSFFTRWPLSHTVKIEWPEVYYKATHFAVMRSTWYCKYDPFPELRDEPPSDDPKLRLKVADDIQRAIWNILLPDTAFSSDEVALKAAIREENSQRWLAYGPGAHGQDDETGVETYRSMRVEGYVGGGDAPEYEEYAKQMDKAKKKQKKHAASNLEPWASSG